MKKRLLLFIALFLISLFLLFQPWNISGIQSHPNPVSAYPAALQRIEQLKAQESASMNPDCEVQLLTFGRKMSKAIILVHGYTNCPVQFYQLGQQFYNLGYNVLIAPLPHHGLADRMTDAHAHLKAEEMAAYADEVVDIAQGLGEAVVMAGLSAGGVVTAWAAQNRKDLDRAVLISPAFGFKPLPAPVTAAAMNLFSLLPDAYTWWDPVKRDKNGPAHAYPRYSRRALVQILRLSFALQAKARREAPQTKDILLITNGNDAAVNADRIERMKNFWRHQGISLKTYHFQESLQLDHDLIDPYHPDERVELVYPKLVELIK